MDGGVFTRDGFISFKMAENGLEYSRFGFVVGQKISKKAVDRNTIKRRLSEAVFNHIKEIRSGVDIVILPSPQILNKEYSEIQKEIEGLLKKAKVLE